MSKLYIEVKASERLPDKDDEYLSDQGWIKYDCDQEEFGYWDQEYPDGPEEYVIIPVNWWLEPIEITEEEIMNIIHSNIVWRDEDCTPIIHADKSARMILSKLKGE